MLRRRTRVLLVAALCAISGTVRAVEPPPIPDFAVDKALRPTDAMPERLIQWSHPGVTMTDMVYSTIPGFRALHLDLYRSAAAPAPQPLIVFVHGGGYAHANARAGAAFMDLPAQLAYLAERGYVVASIEYRFSGEAPFPAQLEDLQAAIRFLRSNAARLGIDGARIGSWGMSAGAHLAALNAVHCADGACVQAFAGWFGTYDLPAHLRDTPLDPVVAALFRCGNAGCETGVLEAASPIHHVDRNDPPTLLIHGLHDTLALPSQSERFAKELQDAGVDARLVLIPEVDHGFVGSTPAVTKDALRQALAATFDFFDRVLKGAPSAQVP
jgi:acetyl esterase/lipase